MQLIAEKSELLRAVDHAASVVAAKNAIPVLSHLVLTANRETGTVRATDLDMEVTAPFAAQAVTEQGRVCVPARLFRDIVKRMPDGKPISLTYFGGEATGGGKLRVVCGKSKFELATLNPDDHPAFSAPANKDVWRFEVEAAMLRRILAGVRHAVSKDESRYYLQGIYLHVTANEPVHNLTAVATNGHIMALQSCRAPTGAYSMPGVIVPDATVAQMLKILPDTDQLVELTVSNSFIWLDFPSGLSLSSKLIEGTYPDYQRVIPRGNPYSMRCDADALATAVDRVATVCSSEEKTRQVVVLMNPKGGLTVTAQSASLGSGKDSVDTVEAAKKKVAIGFNSRYLLQILSSYSGGTVELRYASAADAVLVTARRRQQRDRAPGADAHAARHG